MYVCMYIERYLAASSVLVNICNRIPFMDEQAMQLVALFKSVLLLLALLPLPLLLLLLADVSR